MHVDVRGHDIAHCSTNASTSRQATAGGVFADRISSGLEVWLQVRTSGEVLVLHQNSIEASLR
jgi:hypothetical protein